VVVPLLEEFRDRPVLLSASTIERRVRRLITKGELPATDACIKCGHLRTAEVVNTALECERYRTRVYGGGVGFLFLILILPLWLFVFWVLVFWRKEEQRVEHYGRDTDVPAPVCLCTECHRRLGSTGRWKYVIAAGLFVAISVLVGYFHVL